MLKKAYDLGINFFEMADMYGKGRVGKSDWFIKDLGKGKYDITQKIKDKGLVPVAGTKFRISTYKSTIEVK